MNLEHAVQNLHSLNKRLREEPEEQKFDVLAKLRRFLDDHVKLGQKVISSKCQHWHGTSAICLATCPATTNRCRADPKCPSTCPTNALKAKKYCKSGHGGASLCPVTCPTNALKAKKYCKSGHGGTSLCPATCPTNALKLKSYCKSGHGGWVYCKAPCMKAGGFKRACTSCNGGQLCSICAVTIISRKGDMCRSCAPVALRQARTREARMAATLSEWADTGLIQNYTLWNRRNPSADPVQCGIYRVDFVFEQDTHMLLLEYDEGMHADREKRCELVRQAHCSLGYGGRPVHWIRFNPDAFKVDGVTRVTTRKEREAVLLKLIQAGQVSADYEHFITLDYLCYDKKLDPGGSDLVQTYKFKTIEAYSAWVDDVAPA